MRVSNSSAKANWPNPIHVGNTGSGHPSKHSRPDENKADTNLYNSSITNYV